MFSDLLNISTSNASKEEDITILGFNKFALILQDIDIDRFRGQTLAVNLGSVDDALNSQKGFEKSLITSEMMLDIIENSTALVQLPANLTEGAQELLNTSTSKERLSYGVFLSDVLFKTGNKNASVGSIILSTRMKNSSLQSPITLSLRTVHMVKLVPINKFRTLILFHL